MKLSVIIITKNEENNIIDCIESVKLADEIIVIDSNSTDRTKSLLAHLKNEKIKVFTRDLNSNFSEQRNFALTKARGEWVLFLDADERIHDSLSFEISQKIYQPNNVINGYYIKRNDYLWGRELRYGDVGSVKLLRLAKVNAGLWKGFVHEKWNVGGRKELLINPILHYPHKSLHDFLVSINFYSSLRAEELFSKNVHSSLPMIVLYPQAKFILNFFFKKGYRDGIHGLIHALLMSFHSFLVRGKLWLLWDSSSRKQ